MYSIVGSLAHARTRHAVSSDKRCTPASGSGHGWCMPSSVEAYRGSVRKIGHFSHGA